MLYREVTFNNVCFEYESAASPIIKDFTSHFTVGWTGIVGANGSGKTTILKLATGELKPDRGTINHPEKALYCPQRTDNVPPRFEDLIKTNDGGTCKLKGLLKIEDGWLYRWDTLSHGERKRAQIGYALWCKPEILAVDEPTNHIDSEAREVLMQALNTFRGVGLLVSHDRELLDFLCRQCLFIDPPDLVMRPGGYSAGFEQAKREELSAQRKKDIAQVQYRKLKREVIRRKEKASRADSKRSKRHLDRHDSDGRFKMNAARLTGKDATAGKLLRQIEKRSRKAYEKQKQIKVKKHCNLGIFFSAAYSKRDVLFELCSGVLPLGGEKELHFPGLVMYPNDRIAVTGSNGSGKSSLVKHIVQSLKIREDTLLYIPQEISLREGRTIISRIMDRPEDKLGRIMTIVSRLGSAPEKLFETADPSPGEVRKLMLADGITRSPCLIIMDEPTNHLDIVSIACLEDALDECRCGLLLVSHDKLFLRRLTRKCWHIEENNNVAEIRITSV